MIELEYNSGRIEVKYILKGQKIVMTPDEMIAHIGNNGTINEGVGFVVPFSVYSEVREQAERIEAAIEYGKERRR